MQFLGSLFYALLMDGLSQSLLARDETLKPFTLHWRMKSLLAVLGPSRH
jgi:hypothetical protein